VRIITRGPNLKYGRTKIDKRGGRSLTSPNRIVGRVKSAVRKEGDLMATRRVSEPFRQEADECEHDRRDKGAAWCSASLQGRGRSAERWPASAGYEPLSRHPHADEACSCRWTGAA
jgi:hypothetical protein